MGGKRTMTKNELKKEMYLMAGCLIEFEKITTAQDKKELEEHRIQLHKKLKTLVEMYNIRYPAENTSDIECIINKKLIE